MLVKLTKGCKTRPFLRTQISVSKTDTIFIIQEVFLQNNEICVTFEIFAKFNTFFNMIQVQNMRQFCLFMSIFEG